MVRADQSSHYGDMEIHTSLSHTHTLELAEADAVVCLCGVQGHRFGYALANGIVGVYGGEERHWRIKVKQICNQYT